MDVKEALQVWADSMPDDEDPAFDREREALATLHSHIEARPSEDVESLLAKVRKRMPVNDVGIDDRLIAALRDAFVRVERERDEAMAAVKSFAPAFNESVEDHNKVLAENTTLRERLAAFTELDQDDIDMLRESKALRERLEKVEAWAKASYQFHRWDTENSADTSLEPPVSLGDLLDDYPVLAALTNTEKEGSDDDPQ